MATTIPAEPPLLEAFDKEALVHRNPHRDFPAVQASRVDYGSEDHQWKWSKTPKPDWTPGEGASFEERKGGAGLGDWVHIDPKEEGRETNQNYKLLISTTVPRPIALVSTVSADGLSSNIAPFSYFQNICSDPPLYSLSFAATGGAIDTLKNLLETEECCISIVGDWFIEAANYTSTNAPPGTSEWALSGLHAVPSNVVRPTYVAESAFSVECKLYSKQQINSPTTGERSAMLCIVQAVQFHVREDALIGGRDGERSTVDITKLRPVFRAGGITYGTAAGGFELLRPEAFKIAREREEVKGLIKEKVEGQ